MRYLFFTDIDGTLIDHYTYSAERSIGGIKLLADMNIPLIAVSSKTFDEMLLLINSLGLNYPFSFENGTGIAFPVGSGGYSINVDGPGYDALDSFMPEIESMAGLHLTAIKSLTDVEISEITGLDLKAAALAKNRKSTLPFIAQSETLLPDSIIVNINERVRNYGFYITKGGRFNHLIPSGSGKGVAVKKIIEFYMNSFNDALTAAAAGDSVNDIPMLMAVDSPYIVRKPDGSFISLENGRIMTGTGPDGFTEAVKDFIKTITG